MEVAPCYIVAVGTDTDPIIGGDGSTATIAGGVNRWINGN